MSEALFLIAGLIIGYFNRDVVAKVKSVQESVKERYVVKQERLSEKSTIVEALTPEQQARKDMEERVKRLNGQS